LFSFITLVLLVELPRAPYGGLIVILFSFTNIKKKKKRKEKEKQV
jgi:hypothetical protein